VVEEQVRPWLSIHLQEVVSELVELLESPLVLVLEVQDLRIGVRSNPFTFTSGGRILTAQPLMFTSEKIARNMPAMNLFMVNFLSGKFQNRKSTLRIQGTYLYI
jgi:hypothetical protein